MRLRAAVAAMVACLVAAPALGATAVELRALLASGKAEEAYRAGRASPERLGEPAFDYAFGVAAIEVGKAAEGVLALERVLLADPDDDEARVALARGYFNLGEDARAREEFETAAAHHPPAALAGVIEEYLAAIRVRVAKYEPTAMAYVMLGGGHDSNPRAGVDNPEITLPVFGSVTVVDSGLRVGSRAAEASAGLRATTPFSPGVTAFAAASADASRYAAVGEFDQALYAGTAGLASRRGAWAWRAAASGSYQRLGGVPYRRVHGFALDGSWQPGARDAFTAGVQRGRFAYDGANAVRDADFTSASLSWKHLLAGAWRPEVELALNGGREENRLADRQDLSRRLRGARLAAAISPLGRWTLSTGASWLASDYLEPDLVLQATREDRYAVVEFAVEWRFAPGLAARAELSAARNRSNLELYEYDRRTAMLRLRYETR